MSVPRRGAPSRAPRTNLEIQAHRIVVGDCVAEMTKLPADSVDLVFADPPYNLQLQRDLKRPDDSKVDAVDDDWDQFASFAAYDAFTRAWLTACKRVLKPSGTLWVIGSYHNIFRAGTGTTGAVATSLGRRNIGIERDPAYAKAAEKRIAAVKPLEAPSLAPFMTAREAPRVAFASLIERGMISAGAKLVDAKKKHRVLVRADGAVALGEAVGSIHRIGALAQGLDACNGWTFWHVETPKGLTLIDALRAQIRAEMGAAPVH